MAYEIIWLPKAEERFDEIIYYLQENSSEKVVINFISKTNKKLFEIKLSPTMFSKSDKMGIYEALITKHNLLLYRVEGNRIELLTFFDTRQNPNKKLQ